MGGYYTQIKERDARIAELEQQLTAAQAKLAALRESVKGLRMSLEEVSQFGIQDFDADELLADLRDTHRIIAQQREQLAASDARCAELEREVERAAGVIADFIRSKRDAWVRTADRLPTEADAPHGVIAADWVPGVGWIGKTLRPRYPKLVRSYARTHWLPLPAPPADDEGGDDEQS